MYQFTFVILHYQSLQDTIECIESILINVNYKNFNIVIVDNGSPDNSGMKLIDKYEKIENVKVLLNETNLGFSKGNNVGFQYAKKVLKSSFIALINNDTIINQEDFIEVIITKYENTRYHVLGPDILSIKDGGHQSPIREKGLTLIDIKRKLWIYRFLLMLNYLGIEGLLRSIKNFLLKKKNSYDIINSKFEFEKTDVQLHGSCMIFSADYINLYDGLYDEIFMYMEEDFLYYISKRDNLKLVYYPSVQILHKEDSSTDSVFKKSTDKRRFIYRNVISSAKKLHNLIISSE